MIERMRAKRSVLWKLPDEYIQDILDSSPTMTEVCKRLGVSTSNGSSKTVHKRIETLSLDKFKANHERFKKSLGRGRALSHSEIFTVDSTVARKTVRKVIIRDNLLPYVCFECGLSPFWNRKILSLQLEHRNGINNDHRLENLCFLCPNCHSQTPTYAGKKNKGR